MRPGGKVGNAPAVTVRDEQLLSNWSPVSIGMTSSERCCPISTEQLRLTMVSHSQSEGLYTSFQPCPSPVVVEKAPGLSCLVGGRLALAVRLARRDLQHGLEHKSTYQSTSQTLPYSSQYAHSSLRLCESARREGEGAEGGLGAAKDTTQTKTDDPCSTNGGGDVTGHRHQVKEGGVKDGGDGVGEGVRGDARTSPHAVRDELAQLKLELNQQVQRLRELCARKTECGGTEEEEERKRKRSAKQVAMMARKLYDLQNQVWATGVQRKPLAHKKRLAAARRAAARALHNYTCTPHPLPSELLEMVGVLCGRGDRQSVQLLSLAQMYSDVLRSAQPKGRYGCPSQQPTVRYKRKKSPGKRPKRHQLCGVVIPQQPLRSRRGGLIHFSQPTLSSTAKSRPSVRRSTHTPSQVRDSEHAELTINSKKSGRKAEQGQVRDMKAATVPTATMEDGGVEGGEKADESREGGKGDGDGQETDGSSLPESDTLTVTPLQPQFASPSSIFPPPLLPSSPSSPVPNGPSTVEECQRLGQRRAVKLQSLVAMATSLQQMEEVEVEIRQKWNGRSCTEPLGGYHPSNTSSSSYSRRSEWGLPSTTPVDRGEFELWKLMKRLANDLLEESIDAVCEEMSEICKGLTTNIFSSEFFTPATVPQNSYSSHLCTAVLQ